MESKARERNGSKAMHGRSAGCAQLLHAFKVQGCLSYEDEALYAYVGLYDHLYNALQVGEICELPIDSEATCKLLQLNHRA